MALSSYEFGSKEHGMDARLQTEDEILREIEIYSDYGSSIGRKNLNIKYLLGIIKRLRGTHGAVS